jgi:cytochrome b561
MLRTAPSTGRYTRVAIVLHWLIALLVLGQFTLGWTMQQIGKHPAGPRAFAFNVHKSVGLTILLLMALRIAWRMGHRPPALTGLAGWETRLARANHFALYAALVVLPLTGYLGSAFSGFPVHFYGIVLPAWSGAHPHWKSLLGDVHLVTTWVLAAALALHLAAVAKHLFEGRFDVVARMTGGSPLH